MNTSLVDAQINKQKLRMLELYQAKDDIQTELASILQIISSLEFALSTETDPNTLIDKDKLSG